MNYALALLRAFAAPRTPVEPRPGEKVRVRPRGRRDALDLIAEGELATVLSVEEDFEGKRYVTVTMDGNQGRDLGKSGQLGHRFFFEPDELERLP